MRRSTAQAMTYLFKASMLFLAVLFLIEVLVSNVQAQSEATPLETTDEVLQTVREPIAAAAAVCALAVTLQTDLQGKDDAKSLCNIHEVTGPISDVSNKRDVLAGTARSIALLWRQLTN
jgi:hypothetical protein